MGGGASLIRYSFKTAERNSMIVPYMTPYCTSYLKFLSAWFWGFPEQNKDFAIQNMGERGYHFVSIAHSISSFPLSCLEVLVSTSIRDMWKRLNLSLPSCFIIWGWFVHVLSYMTLVFFTLNSNCKVICIVKVSRLEKRVYLMLVSSLLRVDHVT